MMRRIGLSGFMLGLFVIGVFVTVPLFEEWRLEDFANTFYRVGQNLVRGENIYLSAYPHPTNGRDYPPYAPIWIWYALVPFAVFPLSIAQAARFLLDIMALPFLAYLSMRWAGINAVRLMLMLVLAPWLLTELSTGQLTPLVFIGVLLCYWGVRRPSAAMTAIGLLLASSKFTIVSLVLLATLIFAWRAKILSRTLAILAALIFVASLASPTWMLDLIQLYLSRLAYPRLSDSILLLPGYPWMQLGLLMLGVWSLVIYIWRFNVTRPTPWLWAVLLTASLVGALHTFVYDWQLLMVPLAILIRSRLGLLLTIVLYLYSLVWAVLSVGLEVSIPSPAIIPSVVLLAILAWKLFVRIDISHPIASEGGRM